MRGWLPGVIISLVAVWALSRLVDWHEVWLALSRLPAERLALAVLFYLLAAGARALAWQTILQHQASLARTFFVLQEGYLLNNLLPFRLGELGRAVLLGQQVQGGTLYVLSTIAIERIYDLALAAAFLLMALPFLFDLEIATGLAVTTLVVTLGALIFFYALARQRSRVQGWLQQWLGQRWGWLDLLLHKTEGMIQGFGVLGSLRSFGLSLGWMLICWGCLAAEYFVLIQAIAPQAEWTWAMFALSVGMVGAALPSAPAGLGVYEASLVGALALLQIPFAPALSVALTLHLIHIVLSGLAGLWALNQEQETLAGIYRRIQTLLSRRSTP